MWIFMAFSFLRERPEFASCGLIRDNGVVGFLVWVPVFIRTWPKKQFSKCMPWLPVIGVISAAEQNGGSRETVF